MKHFDEEKLVKSILRKILKEDLEKDKVWYKYNDCLSQYHNLKLNGLQVGLEVLNGEIWFQSNGNYTIYPKKKNPNSPSYLYPPKFGKWWCDSTTKKLVTKRNPSDKFDVEDLSNDTKKSGLIPKASTMDDIKTGKGYIIKNMNGPVVKELQQMLLKLGYDLGPQKDDSNFGGKTFDALVDFQKDNGIQPKNNVFGIFGKTTYNKMVEKLNKLM